MGALEDKYQNGTWKVWLLGTLAAGAGVVISFMFYTVLSNEHRITTLEATVRLQGIDMNNQVVATTERRAEVIDQLKEINRKIDYLLESRGTSKNAAH